ncbi:hypothetical protein VZT92_011797 [Zoarces viviparus]|uniref:Uncharacterized protein n=1 Tax=Zoarces viviparus TaxID=48416 RepID=A0AAW1F698_ZOAVI
MGSTSAGTHARWLLTKCVADLFLNAEKKTRGERAGERSRTVAQLCSHLVHWICWIDPGSQMSPLSDGKL